MDILEAFCNDLRNKGLKKNQVIQYSNQVHFIWESLDPSLQLYPKSAFSNNYALQDLYRRPTFNRIGKDGVEASTMRARYTSLSYYIAFLRKRHVYAGLSRADLTNLSENMNDLNKKLGPRINETEVSIRKRKKKTANDNTSHNQVRKISAYPKFDFHI